MPWATKCILLYWHSTTFPAHVAVAHHFEKETSRSLHLLNRRDRPRLPSCKDHFDPEAPRFNPSLSQRGCKVEREGGGGKKSIGADVLESRNQSVRGPHPYGDQSAYVLDGIRIGCGNKKRRHHQGDDAVVAEPSGPEGPGPSPGPSVILVNPIKSAFRCTACGIDPFDFAQSRRGRFGEEASWLSAILIFR
jgi:hypothetical protein